MIKGILLKKLIFILLLFLFSSGLIFAGRGCCSWHGGQSYCDSNTGRRVCRDGTYSPTCRCSGGSSYGSYNTCPLNSSKGSDGKCYCNEGYKTNLELNICENMNNICKEKYPGTIYRAYDDKCICPYDGYLNSSWNKSINNCPINDKYCKYYDENSIYLGNGNCGCKDGYEVNYYGNACIKKSLNKESNNEKEDNESSNHSDVLWVLGFLVFYIIIRK